MNFDFSDKQKQMRDAARNSSPKNAAEGGANVLTARPV